MKIAIVHADHYNDRQGGGELTTKYWYEQGLKEGLDITWVHNNNVSEYINQNFDFYLIGNFPDFKPISYIKDIINTKPHAFLCHNSIQWHGFMGYYRNAKFTVTLAPDHAGKIGLEKLPNIVTAPYVDHTLFKPEPFVELPWVQVYVGLIHPIKVGYDMISYIKNNPDIQFHFYGKLDMKMTKLPNLQIFPQVDNKELPELYNSYKTFFWRLNRYGCYGRTLVEALLCEMELNVNTEAFGLFKYPWIDQGRNAIIDALEEDRQTFWNKVLTKIDA